MGRKKREPTMSIRVSIRMAKEAKELAKKRGTSRREEIETSWLKYNKFVPHAPAGG